MYCPTCGKQIPENSAFCLHCGKPVPTLPAAAPVIAPPIIPAAQQKAPISEEAIRKIKELLSQGSKIPAIQQYRDETGADLQEAKNFVEAIETDIKASHPVAVPATPPAVSAAPVTPVPAAVPPSSASGEFAYTDWILEFPAALRHSLSIGLSGRGAPSIEEIRQRIWSAYQNVVTAGLQKWMDQGWQPVNMPGPSCLEMRIAKDYRDKNVLYWILMIIAIPVTAGISLLVALLPRPFVEPTRFIVKMRAARGVRVPELPIMPVS